MRRGLLQLPNCLLVAHTQKDACGGPSMDEAWCWRSCCHTVMLYKKWLAQRCATQHAQKWQRHRLPAASTVQMSTLI